MSPTKYACSQYLSRIISYYILSYIFLARLSHDQGEPDAREETCMETQMYILVKVRE